MKGVKFSSETTKPIKASSLKWPTMTISFSTEQRGSTRASKTSITVRTSMGDTPYRAFLRASALVRIPMQSSLARLGTPIRPYTPTCTTKRFTEVAFPNNTGNSSNIVFTSVVALNTVNRPIMVSTLT